MKLCLVNCDEVISRNKISLIVRPPTRVEPKYSASSKPDESDDTE